MPLPKISEKAYVDHYIRGREQALSIYLAELSPSIDGYITRLQNIEIEKDKLDVAVQRFVAEGEEPGVAEQIAKAELVQKKALSIATEFGEQFNNQLFLFFEMENEELVKTEVILLLEEDKPYASGQFADVYPGVSLQRTKDGIYILPGKPDAILTHAIRGPKKSSTSVKPVKSRQSSWGSSVFDNLSVLSESDDENQGVVPATPVKSRQSSWGSSVFDNLSVLSGSDDEKPECLNAHGNIDFASEAEAWNDEILSLAEELSTVYSQGIQLPNLMTAIKDGKKGFADEQTVMTAAPFCEYGTLGNFIDSYFEKVKDSSEIDSEQLIQAYTIFLTLSLSLAQIHQNDCVHNDLSINNILVKQNENGILESVIFDFSGQREFFAGTRGFGSPEARTMIQDREKFMRDFKNRIERQSEEMDADTREMFCDEMGEISNDLEKHLNRLSEGFCQLQYRIENDEPISQLIKRSSSYLTEAFSANAAHDVWAFLMVSVCIFTGRNYYTTDTFFDSLTVMDFKGESDLTPDLVARELSNSLPKPVMAILGPVFALLPENRGKMQEVVEGIVQQAKHTDCPEFRKAFASVQNSFYDFLGEKPEPQVSITSYSGTMYPHSTKTSVVDEPIGDIADMPRPTLV